MGGLRKACDKRAIPLAHLESIIDQIEKELIDAGEREIPAYWIGEKIMGHLRQTDEIAYVRFASVYRSFRDIDELMSELEKIARTRQK